MHKDIVDYIYKLIHQSNVIDIIKEYNNVLKCDNVNDSCSVCEHSYYFSFDKWTSFQINYRIPPFDFPIYSIHSHTSVSYLPKNYYTTRINEYCTHHNENA